MLGTDTTNTAGRGDFWLSAGVVRCGSVPSSAGRTARQASWCSQPPCRRACGSLASCISAWRSGLQPLPCFRPLLIRDASLEICEGSWERSRASGPSPRWRMTQGVRPQSGDSGSRGRGRRSGVSRPRSWARWARSILWFSLCLPRHDVCT